MKEIDVLDLRSTTTQANYPLLLKSKVSNYAPVTFVSFWVCKIIVKLQWVFLETGTFVHFSVLNVHLFLLLSASYFCSSDLLVILMRMALRSRKQRQSDQCKHLTR